MRINLTEFNRTGSKVYNSQMERAAEFQEKTQIVAAEQLQRVCYALELEPKYCAVTLERLSQMGLKPRLLKPRQIKARKAA